MGNSQKNNGPMIGHNTNVITAQCLEGGFVRIPNQGHLRTAWFGQASGSHGRNVTKKASQYIRKNFKEGRDHILWASTEWWGDPWSGSKKKLLITYTMPVGLTVHEPNQHNRTITANEGQYVSIPMDVSVIKAFWGKPSEPKKKNVTDKVKKILKSCGRRPFCATRKTLGNPWFNSGSLVLILECSEPIKVYQDNASIPVADVVVEVVDTQSDFEKKSVQSTPVQSMPVQSMPVQAVPVQSMPVQAVPVQSMPVQAVPVQSMPVQPVQTMPVQAVPVQPIPVVQSSTSIKTSPVVAHATRIEGNTSVQGTFVQATPVVGSAPMQGSYGAQQTTPVLQQQPTAPSAPPMLKYDE